MATTHGGVSSNGLLMSEPQHAESSSRKGSGEDASLGLAGPGCGLGGAFHGSSPNGDCKEEACDTGMAEPVTTTVDTALHFAEPRSASLSRSDVTPASLGSPTSSARQKEPKQDDGRVEFHQEDVVFAPTDPFLRPLPQGQDSAPPMSNGLLRESSNALVCETERALSSRCDAEISSIAKALGEMQVVELSPESSADSHSLGHESDLVAAEQADCAEQTTSEQSVGSADKRLPSCNGQELQGVVTQGCQVVASATRPSDGGGIGGATGKHGAVPNGDVGRGFGQGSGVGSRGRTVLSAAADLPEVRRRSASDGAVQENGWARRGQSSHSECNGLDRRTAVLSSAGSSSSSGSTEGPDSPLAGEVLGSGVRWSGGGRSVSEVKELAYARLQAELSRAQQELRLRDEEVARLSQIRDQVGAELEELTASLFEEANNMVREANMKQATAEKRLQEATLKVEVLQAEVSALKALVLTSTPSRPNAHLHPQLGRHRHRRSPSNYELATSRPPSPPSQTLASQQGAAGGQAGGGSDGSPDLSEADPVCQREFARWQEGPRLVNGNREDPFVARLYREDVVPCLHFPGSQLAAQVLRAIEDNCITIEAVNTANPFPRRCSLLEVPRICQYRMRLGDSGAPWHHISQLCRNRITSVCDLFCYLRYIQQGLVRSSLQEMYWEVMRRRRSIALARLGLPC